MSVDVNDRKIVQHKNSVEFDGETPTPPSKRRNGLLVVSEITGIPENLLYLVTPYTFIHTFSMELEFLSNRI